MSIEVVPLIGVWIIQEKTRDRLAVGKAIFNLSLIGRAWCQLIKYLTGDSPFLAGNRSERAGEGASPLTHSTWVICSNLSRGWNCNWFPVLRWYQSRRESTPDWLRSTIRNIFIFISLFEKKCSELRYEGNVRLGILIQGKTCSSFSAYLRACSRRASAELLNDFLLKVHQRTVAQARLRRNNKSCSY